MVAKVELVGSISKISHTWLWAWANFAFDQDARNRMLVVREAGENRGFPHLTVPKWSGDEVDGWEMTSIAAMLLDARAVYRIEDENSFAYLLITELNLTT